VTVYATCGLFGVARNHSTAFLGNSQEFLVQDLEAMVEAAGKRPVILVNPRLQVNASFYLSGYFLFWSFRELRNGRKEVLGAHVHCFPCKDVKS
jgi:hypothetical protein